MLNYKVYTINHQTNVVGSITELSQPPGQPLDFPFLGDGAMQILNIAPEDDGNAYLRSSVSIFV
jgi:hypothetical protein